MTTRPNFYDLRISRFVDVSAKRAKTITLRSFLDECRNPDKETMEKIRLCRESQSSKEERDKIKRSLPCVTLSCVFGQNPDPEQSDRNTGNPDKVPSGLVCVDCDSKDNPGLTAEAMKKILSECGQTLYCAVSLGGKGVFAIMRLLFPECYIGQFKALRRMCKRSLGLVIDEAYKNYAQPRTITYDPAPYENPEAEPFALVDPPEEKKTNNQLPADTDPASTIRKVGLYVEEIERLNMDIAQTRDEWVNVGFALHTIGDDIGKEYFYRVSAFWVGPNGTHTTSQDIERFWRSIHKDDRARAITIATFFDQCHKYGIRPYIPTAPQPTAEEEFDGFTYDSDLE